jgi:hypothetical protein
MARMMEAVASVNKAENSLVRAAKLAILQKSARQVQQPAAAFKSVRVVLIATPTDHAGQILHGVWHVE